VTNEKKNKNMMRMMVMIMMTFNLSPRWRMTRQGGKVRFYSGHPELLAGSFVFKFGKWLPD
jgi:hypothetical protein